MEITTPFGVKASKARSVMSLSGDGIGAADAGKRSEPSWDPRFDLKIGNQTLRELKILPHCPRGDLSFRNQTEHGEQEVLAGSKPAAVLSLWTGSVSLGESWKHFEESPVRRQTVRKELASHPLHSPSSHPCSHPSSLPL